MMKFIEVKESAAELSDSRIFRTNELDYIKVLRNNNGFAIQYIMINKAVHIEGFETLEALEARKDEVMAILNAKPLSI